jgi:flavin reductase (DIM6/NTAB) family NADH-FMN oxidoreductase RutF
MLITPPTTTHRQNFPMAGRHHTDRGRGRARAAHRDEPPDVSARFEGLVGALDYPMFIVTAASRSERDGCLVGFTTQSSIDPPRFLVCLSDKNRTFRLAQVAEAMAVHLVPAGAIELAELFGSRTGDRVDKLARCRWSPGPQGVPLLADCPDWFVGRILERFPGGDHWCFLLDPIEASDGSPEPPLTFRRTKHLEPGHEA